MNDIERARLSKIDDNMKITPIELMKLLIDDIERGIIQIDGIVIVTAHRPTDGRWTYETRRSQMARDQELTALVMAQERCIRNWIAT